MTSATTLHHVPVTDGHVAAFDGGEGHGPPLVLLHGGGLDHRSWEPQARALRRAHRVIALDLRGHGASSTPKAPFRHADDVAAVLDALDAAPAVLAGVSMGASAAVDLAVTRPEAVAGVVAVGAGAGGPEFRDPWTLGVLAAQDEAARAGDAPAWVEAFLRFAAGPSRSLDDVDEAVVALLRECVTSTLARHVAAGPPVLPEWAEDAAGRARHLTVPVLAVVGEEDSADHARQAAELVAPLPQGRLVTVPGAAHYPHLERPAAVEAALTRFLDDLGEEPPGGLIPPGRRAARPRSGRRREGRGSD
ncbi:alpha/beta fold hydrolase [Isoptericola sp. BMS4]|uniref:alpha/beta fold hydrolase n=1 Tax=Isoptericola sp. BMS4 TaxID=2527875 RepID=UPI00141E5691|nr:alpha/beta hydrolase [Isoptericola sp. BMS4]